MLLKVPCPLLSAQARAPAVHNFVRIFLFLINRLPYTLFIYNDLHLQRGLSKLIGELQNLNQLTALAEVA